MTTISDLDCSSTETNASRFCLRKAKDCQRIALTTDHPTSRRTFLKLAELWLEMAHKAAEETIELPMKLVSLLTSPGGPRSNGRPHLDAIVKASTNSHKDRSQRFTKGFIAGSFSVPGAQAMPTIIQTDVL
jgi:hypothetical protein